MMFSKVSIILFVSYFIIYHASINNNYMILEPVPLAAYNFEHKFLCLNAQHFVCIKSKEDVSSISAK